MKRGYDHQAIEKEVNERWVTTESSICDVKNDQAKYYCLDMFPYPSGDGLHVGHWRGYVLSDFYARYQRLMGKNVLHPIGFDAFGLPAENAAIKNKSHPKKFTDQAINIFTTQLKQIGATYDWSKVINTSSPEYYRWTQWLFLQFFKHGMAVKRKSLVNWCPKDKTVLANEQVVTGKCERCGTDVTKKELSQWYLTITKYAEELLNGLDDVDWPDHVKTLQRNWIGKSVGTSIIFKGDNNLPDVEVFTTRADTLMGVSAVVLAPENSLAKTYVNSHKISDFERYLKLVLTKTNIDRTQTKEGEKTAFNTGNFVIHPITGKKIPVWVADYVLSEYGTGAVMSVPAHDERDLLFSKVHHLDVLEVIKPANDTSRPFTGKGILYNSGQYDGLSSEKAIKKITEDLEHKHQGKLSTTYRLRDWLVSRQRYWGAPIPIIYDTEGKPHAVKEEHLPILLPEDVDFLPGGESPIARSHTYQKEAEKLYGKGWRFDTDTLDTFVDSSWYYLRYLTPSDKKSAFDPKLVQAWLPVDLYIGGIEHAILHLLYARFFYRFLVNENYIESSNKEPFQKLFNIGMVNLGGNKMSKSKGNIVSPNPLIEHYGTDALRGYEMFIGPLDVEAEWNPRGINGVHRFLVKLYTLFADICDDKPANESDKLFDRYLIRIHDMITNYRVNTIVSEAMKLLNDFEKTPASRKTMEKFLITLSPIYPYLTEHLWRGLGHKNSIFKERWPQITSSTLEDVVKWSIRINHKHLAELKAPSDIEQADLARQAGKIDAIATKLNNKAVKQIIFKPKIGFLDLVTD